MRHRVAITGIGAVTPLGTGIDAFWRGVLDERIAVRPLTRFPAAGYASRLAAQIDDFDPSTYLAPKRVRWTDRFSQLAIAASALALDDAALDARGREDAGVWIGSALGGLAYADEQHDVFRTQGLGAIRPLLAISVYGAAAATNVSLEFDLRGPTLSNGNSCASGAIAIGEAARAIARGDVTFALAGGCEAPLAPLVYGAFVVVRAMSTRNDDPAGASRPFDARRDGFVMAEGAATVVLERLADARARGTRVYAEVCGYALSNDAHHPSAPRPDGSANAAAMRNALADAGVGADEVELINAHGSGTPLGDAAEARAIRLVFGDRTDRLPVTATKGQHGHALGATGAMEAGLAALSIAHGIVPRVVNSDDADPECAVDVVRRRRDLAPRIVLSNAAGFGGINAALVLRAVD